ncbi:hypothetical protein BDF14DRAFT_1181269 [Spinellus fusiger]|nr:hypothetical protein BDF14DRAFT_1181269 [Spinellus fusiger]
MRGSVDSWHFVRLDHFDLDPSSITEDQPAYSILASHVQIPLRDQQMINIMLIQKPISKSDVSEWNTRQKEDAHNTTHKLARALADAYVQRYRKNIPRTLTQASATMAEFMQDMTTSLSETDIPAHELEESLDAIEGYVCHALYDSLFCHPEGDEGLEDEALESRIAALNLLDFSLGHLGVVASNASEKAMIEHVVKETGTQLQQLNSITNAKDKLEILVKVHHIIMLLMHLLGITYSQM